MKRTVWLVCLALALTLLLSMSMASLGGAIALAQQPPPPDPYAVDEIAAKAAEQVGMLQQALGQAQMQIIDLKRKMATCASNIVPAPPAPAPPTPASK